MSNQAHLWVVGFDDTARAAGFRDELASLARAHHDLVLQDIAVAIRYHDGTLTINGEPFHRAAGFRGKLASLFAVLALGAPPLCAEAVRPLMGTIGAVPEIGISEHFIQQAQSLIKAGTSALFVLDECGDLDPVLRGLRGLGGTVLKTDVDLERAKLIQSALSASTDPS